MSRQPQIDQRKAAPALGRLASCVFRKRCGWLWQNAACHRSRLPLPSGGGGRFAWGSCRNPAQWHHVGGSCRAGAGGRCRCHQGLKAFGPLGVQVVDQGANGLNRLACYPCSDDGVHFVIRPARGLVPNTHRLGKKPCPCSAIDRRLATVAKGFAHCPYSPDGINGG